MNINIDILNLNRHNFNYGYISEYTDINRRSVIIYTALRLMFVIDQLHDFLEVEERNLLFTNIKKHEEEKQDRKKTITSLYYNIITNFVRGVVDCIKHFTKTDNLQAELKNYNVKATSVFFQEELPFFDLIFKYIGINTIEEPLKIEDKPFLIKNDSNKYLIQDEILLIIFSIKKINIDDSFKKHNAQYICGENFEYLKQLTQANYDSRYYPGKLSSDTSSITITVDADRSKYGVSDIVKQACKFNSNNINFVKTLATHYDASTTSTTENMLTYIKKRTGKTPGGLVDVINIKDISLNSEAINYKLTIKDYVIMDFTYSVETSVIDPLIKIFETIVEKYDADTPNSQLMTIISSTYSQQVVRNIEKILINLKQFIKLYTFEDGTKVFTGYTLNIKTFMEDSPYKILGFPVNVKSNDIDVNIFATILVGIFKLYKIHSDKITLYDFMSEIFPTYKPIIKLFINKYFEIKYSDKIKPDFNSTNSSVRNITNTIITQPMFFNNLETSQDVLYLMAYKTLGDFGQIISFYATNPIISASFGVLDPSRKRIIKAPSRFEDSEEEQKRYTRRRTDKISPQTVDNKSLEYKTCNLQIIDDENEIENIYNNLDKNTIIPSEKIKLFITFDRSCSRISSIFNHGTVFENASMSLSPLELFENICMAKDIEAIIGGGSLYKLVNKNRAN